MAEFGKILVVRLSSIGDIILTTPLLRSLKTAFPNSHVTFIIKKQYEELLTQSPYIDELITFSKKDGVKGLKDIKSLLKSRKFDLYIDIHKNWRSRYLRMGSGVRRISSYRKLIFKRTLLIWFKINLYARIKPVYERYFDSVKPFGVAYDGKGTEISVDPAKIETVRNRLVSAGFDFKRPLVIICPSATYFNKKWKPEGFIETARYLADNKKAFVIVHGGPEDKELCERIAISAGHDVVNMAGTMSLSESAALLGLSNLVIANDSGLLHLAQSQKIPVVGIYGPTTRELGYFPVPEKSTVIETEVSCRPCTHNGLDHCPRGHFRCMNDIPSERVINAALNYLT
ncbi:MAG TPA: glycosyltransferase family 9 protein [Bacteroidales bacterium]|nr:glycosyltransferase family 9 protein [Bacteroidales bacterium]